MEGQEKTVRGIKTFLKTLVTVVLFIIYMFPFYMIVLNAFKHKRDIIKMPLSWGGKKGFTTDNFVDAFQQMNFMNILKHSLIITCVSVFLIILFSSMAAYIFVRKAWKINQIIFMVMLFSMVIPFQVVMIPLISIYGGTFGILNHRATLIFMHLGFSVSMAVFMFHGFIKGWDIPQVNDGMKICGWALNSEYFCTILHLLREDISYRAIVDQLLDVPDDAYTRDTEAVKRIATAYLKLLFPHVKTAADVNPKEFKRYCLTPACKMRRIIRMQISMFDSSYNSELPQFTIREVAE